MIICLLCLLAAHFNSAFSYKIEAVYESKLRKFT
jgi:hypothetical protein